MTHLIVGIEEYGVFGKLPKNKNAQLKCKTCIKIAKMHNKTQNIVHFMGI
jgi:hypothetical protein